MAVKTDRMEQQRPVKAGEGGLLQYNKTLCLIPSYPSNWFLVEDRHLIVRSSQLLRKGFSFAPGDLSAGVKVIPVLDLSLSLSLSLSVCLSLPACDPSLSIAVTHRLSFKSALLPTRTRNGQEVLIVSCASVYHFISTLWKDARLVNATI